MQGSDDEVTINKETGEKVYKIKGALIKYPDGSTERTKMFEILEIPLDDYSDLEFTESEVRRIRMHVMKMKTGIQAMAPLLCSGPVKCPFNKRCPLVDRTKLTPNGTIDFHNQNIKKFPLLRQCCDAKTRVCLSNGQYKEIRDIQVGDLVLSLNTDTHCLEEDEATNVRCNGIKEVYQVSTKGGHEIRLTNDHPFWTAIGKVHNYNSPQRKKYSIKIEDLEHKWMSIQEGIGPSCRVALAEALPFCTTSFLLPDGLPEFLGYYLGDGSYTHYNATFANTNFLYIQEFVELCHKLGTKSAWYRENKLYENRQRSWTVQITNRDRTLDPCRKILQDTGLAKITGKDKRVPKEVFLTNKEQIRLFLNRLWSADGYISTIKSLNPHVEIGILQENFDLVEDIRILLLKFGIHAKIKAEPGKTSDNHRLLVRQARSVKNFLYHIGPIFGKEDACKRASLFMEVASLRADQKENAIKWDFIQSVESVGESEVWDIETKKNHNFVAEGIIVHNCFFEKELLDFQRRRYIEEYDVDIDSPTEMGMINHLAELDLYEMRATLVLAHGDDKGEGLDLLKQQVTGMSMIGEEIKTMVTHPAFELKEKIHRMRAEVLKSMVGTRREKYKQAVALKKQEHKDPSTRIADLREAIKDLESNTVIDAEYTEVKKGE